MRPNWLNIAIGILLSLRNQNLFNDGHKLRLKRINFSLPNNRLNKHIEQFTDIFQKNILLTLILCYLIINKVYVCGKHQSKTKIRTTITIIQVNILCPLCNQSITCYIEVLEWPQVKR